MGQDCILRTGFQPVLAGLFTSDSGGLPTRRRLQTCPTVLAGFRVLGKVCGIGQDCLPHKMPHYTRSSRMLKFKYDREADILHIDKCPPYAEQESEELPDEIVARLNPKTGEVENLEVLFFTTRLLRADLFELPVTADLRLVNTGR